MTGRSDRFVPVESYGVIGDGESVALIARTRVLLTAQQGNEPVDGVLGPA